MRKFFLLFMSVLLIGSAQAATSPTVRITGDSTQVSMAVDQSQKSISLAALSVMKTKDFEGLLGQKLSFFGKLRFKLKQTQLRKKLRHGEIVDRKLLLSDAGKLAYDEGGFHLGGFALGFFIPIIGLLIAYAINDENKTNRVKWAWIGTGLIGSILLLTAAVFSGFH